MSLCPVSWKNTQRYGRKFGRPFIHISAHHSGMLIAVDARGDVWYINYRRDECEPAPDEVTTTARRIRDGVEGDDEWGVELRRRLSEVAHPPAR